MQNLPNWKNKKLWLVLIGLLSVFLILTFGNNTNKYGLPKTVDFNYDIRPILSDNCFTCHGPDSSSRKANLRLDTKEAATAILKSGKAAIVPHHPGKSSLLARIKSTDPGFQMPPPEMNKTLSKREVALLQKWIKQGAKWEDYWAFMPPTNPKLPQKIAQQSPPEIIDYLLAQQLKSKGLQAAPRASKSELIRRVSYLLTGLPPSPEEIENFLADTAPNAYEKLVDGYLASPGYGERWARHWMDLVRYGEHMGHEFDFTISGAWRYRDYLIRAFNADVPYDLFVKEHLAGDMITKPRLHPEEGYNESIIGTAYFFLGEGKHSPVSLKGEEVDRIDNMIDVTSKTFQGLTVACARCHDHKFDPIPTTDYYAMYGMLESARLGPLPAKMKWEDQALLQKLDSLRKEVRHEIGATLTTQSLDETRAQKAFIQSLQETSSKDIVSTSIQIGDFRKGNWEGWYTNGWAFGDGPLIGAPYFNTNGDLIDLETPHASSRRYGTGVQGVLHSPYFTIEKDSLSVKARGNGGLIRIVVDNFQLIQNPLWGGFEKIVDNQEWQTYTFNLSMVKGHKAYLAFLPGHYTQHQYRIDPENYVDIQYAYAYDSLFVAPRLNSTPSSLVNHPKTSPKVLHLIATFDSLSRQLHDPAHIIGVAEGDAVFSPVFIRGNKDQLSKEKVPRAFLTALNTEDAAFPQKGSGRLAWAEAVVHRDNPLSSRVMVNRIWHHLFGKGIVESVDNFGLQGKLPTHPELLDYLSIYFMEEGWSIKNLIRQIVLSKSFQQGSTTLSKNQLKDPNNDYLHHFPIRRLEAEAIRDAMLATSGELDTTMYGVPVPIHLTEFMTGRGRPRQSGPLDGNGRRSIYLAIRRNFISPMMSVFDTPVPFSTFGKRNTTNVPAQSLTLMNDPFVHDQASKWASQILSYSNLSLKERIQKIYLKAFARNATPKEVEDAIAFLQDIEKKYATNPDPAVSEHQVWTDYCHTIFNLKEFIHLF
ncbi:MAG: PSD1 and planctomycete cytochrome C domain-containing protein [Saprospiraceae bacterium]